MSAEALAKVDLLDVSGSPHTFLDFLARSSSSASNSGNVAGQATPPVSTSFLTLDKLEFCAKVWLSLSGPPTGKSVGLPETTTLEVVFWWLAGQAFDRELPSLL